MKTLISRNSNEIRLPKDKSSGWDTRSVLDCGDSSPLSPGAIQCSEKSEHSSTWRSVVLPLLCLITLYSSFCLCADGQSNYSIDWSTIDGGGGTSTGGVFSVSGSIGQPEAGKLSGGNYSLEGGFWAIYAIQTPGAPYLTVTRSNNAVIVSWPLPAEGWMLESTNALPQVEASWPQISPPYQTNGANLQFTEPAPTGNKFYRLIKP